ncbi:hypothetical protein [Streptomyces sp. NBC_00513]|uniref:hypothetical protein n=1 Tax=Streptomyces sp. NBC_00513 TaxID=2975763 RepID=UPI00352BD1CA
MLRSVGSASRTAPTGGTTSVYHPVVDEPRLHRDEPAIDDVIFVVHYPDKDSDSDGKLRLIVALSDTESAGMANDRPADVSPRKTP